VLLGWSDRARARPPKAITRKVALLITDKDLREETAYFRRIETVMPLDRVEALIRGDA
jgi:hypothetical protein